MRQILAIASRMQLQRQQHGPLWGWRKLPHRFATSSSSSTSTSISSRSRSSTSTTTGSGKHETNRYSDESVASRKNQTQRGTQSQSQSLSLSSSRMLAQPKRPRKPTTTTTTTTIRREPNNNNKVILLANECHLRRTINCLKCAGFIQQDANAKLFGTRYTKVLTGGVWDAPTIVAFFSRVTEFFGIPLEGANGSHARYLMQDSLACTLAAKYKLSSRRKSYQKLGATLGGFPVANHDRPRRFQNDQPRVPGLALPLLCTNKSQQACRIVCPDGVLHPLSHADKIKLQNSQNSKGKPKGKRSKSTNSKKQTKRVSPWAKILADLEAKSTTQ